MKVKILSEHGFDEAMLGLSLSFNSSPCRMPARALKLAALNPYEGHSKFLEHMVVWLDVTATRAWWSQADTYRIDVSKQSESTMHTGMKHPIRPEMFADKVDPDILEVLELVRQECVGSGDVARFKYNLPEGFLQRRTIRSSYKTLRHINAQRKNHRLEEWAEFLAALRGLRHAHFIFEEAP